MHYTFNTYTLIRTVHAYTFRILYTPNRLIPHLTSAASALLWDTFFSKIVSRVPVTEK